MLLKRLVSSQFVDGFRTTKLDVSLLKKLKTTLMKQQAIFEHLITYKHAAVLVQWPNLFTYNVFHIDILLDEIDTESCKVEETLTTTSHFKLLINYRLQKSIERLEFMTSGAETCTTSYDLAADESSIQLPSFLTSVKVLLDRLDSTEFLNNFARTKLDVSHLENLKKTMLNLESIFGYAEEKQLNLIVRDWLDMLRNVVFEVGYFFDEINPEALRSRVEAEY
ncbi:resistance protein, partial [Trifolium pratense]